MFYHGAFSFGKYPSADQQCIQTYHKGQRSGLRINVFKYQHLHSETTDIYCHTVDLLEDMLFNPHTNGFESHGYSAFLHIKTEVLMYFDMGHSM